MSCLNDLSLRELVDLTGSRQPAPGGGYVAGAVAAFAIGLIEMAYVISRPDVGEQGHVVALAGARQQQLEWAQADADAYAAFSAALKQPRDSAEARALREQAIAKAAWEAIHIPLQAIESIRSVFKVTAAVLAELKPSLYSDVVNGARLLISAVGAHALNIRDNASTLQSVPCKALHEQVVVLHAALSRSYDPLAQRLDELGFPMPAMPAVVVAQRS